MFVEDQTAILPTNFPKSISFVRYSTNIWKDGALKYVEYEKYKQKSSRVNDLPKTHSIPLLEEGWWSLGLLWSSGGKQRLEWRFTLFSHFYWQHQERIEAAHGTVRYGPKAYPVGMQDLTELERTSITSMEFPRICPRVLLSFSEWLLLKAGDAMFVYLLHKSFTGVPAVDIQAVAIKISPSYLRMPFY